MYNAVGETYLPYHQKGLAYFSYLFTGFSLQDFYLSYNSV